MNHPIWIRLAGVTAIVALLVFVFLEERGWRAERAGLDAQIAAAQKLVGDAENRQRERDAKLELSLAGIAVRKHEIQSPQQILRELPKDLPLPTPIVLQTAAQQPSGNESPAGNVAEGGRDVSAVQAPAPGAIIPAEDLKPLYDFVQDCKACQAKLATSQGDLADERAKTEALGHERDAALRVARGGGFWRRVGRAAKWLAIGAAAGAAATAAARR